MARGCASRDDPALTATLAFEAVRCIKPELQHAFFSASIPGKVRYRADHLKLIAAPQWSRIDCSRLFSNSRVIYLGPIDWFAAIPCNHGPQQLRINSLGKRPHRAIAQRG